MAYSVLSPGFSKTRSVLLGAVSGAVLLQAAAIAIGWHAALLSDLCLAALVLVAAAAAFQRCLQVGRLDRMPWLWLAMGLLLWFVGQLCDSLFSPRVAAAGPTPQISDFFFFVVSVPFLLALSSNRESASVRGILQLNMFHGVLGCILIFVRLFWTPLSGEELSRIYGIENALLLIAVTIRQFAWFSAEERRCMRLLCAFMWVYTPVELGSEYLSAKFHLHGGTPLDLLWSLPFLLATLALLFAPMDRGDAAVARNPMRHRLALLLQSFTPTLFTLGVFGLATSIFREHTWIATVAILLSVMMQGLYSGVLQVNYIVGRGQLEQQEDRLRAANRGLERLSLLDPLTGIANRRQFNEVLDTEWKRAARKSESIALLMLDIDFFKSVNDIHGHLYGDDCLVRLAAALQHTLKRGSDLVARYGGEEFVILLPDTTEQGALRVAERFQATIAGLRLRNDGSPVGQVITASIGYAALRPARGGPAAELVALADRALYLAKRQGRNCIRAAESLVEDFA